MVATKTTLEICAESYSLCAEVDRLLTPKGLQIKYQKWVSLDELRDFIIQHKAIMTNKEKKMDFAKGMLFAFKLLQDRFFAPEKKDEVK